MKQRAKMISAVGRSGSFFTATLTSASNAVEASI
jgi:hypothetical protein